MKHFQVKSRLEAENRYGRMIQTDKGRLVWPIDDELKWMEMIVIPPFASKKIMNAQSNQPWTKVYCNKDVARALIDTLELLHIRGLLQEITTFDGCYAPRWVRGRPGIASFHSWGLAFDFNAKSNPLGKPHTWSEEFLNTWRESGWTCGADFMRCDGMHFQLCSDEDKD